jgi:hypothetical protein
MSWKAYSQHTLIVRATPNLVDKPELAISRSEIAAKISMLREAQMKRNANGEQAFSLRLEHNLWNML